MLTEGKLKQLAEDIRCGFAIHHTDGLILLERIGEQALRIRDLVTRIAAVTDERDRARSMLESARRNCTYAQDKHDEIYNELKQLRGKYEQETKEEGTETCEEGNSNVHVVTSSTGAAAGTGCML